jgi:hypothetical protein
MSTKTRISRFHASEKTCSENLQLLLRARKRMASTSSGDNDKAFSNATAKEAGVVAWKPR